MQKENKVRHLAAGSSCCSGTPTWDRSNADVRSLLVNAIHVGVPAIVSKENASQPSMFSAQNISKDCVSATVIEKKDNLPKTSKELTAIPLPRGK